MYIFENLVQLVLIALLILYPILPSYGKFNADMLIVLLALIQILNLLLNKSIRKSFFNYLINLKNNIIFISLMLFNLSMYISVIPATNKATTIGNSIRFSMYLFIFLVLLFNLRDKKRFYLFLNTFVFSNLIVGLYAIYQSIFKSSIIDEAHRITSTLENSNNLGAYTILSIFIVFALICKSKKISIKFMYALVFIAQLFSLITCQSRNALLALFVGSFLFAILYKKQYLIITLVLPIILLIIPAARVRFFEIFDFSQNISRLKVWKISLLMIKDNFLSGVGYENFQYLYKTYVSKNMHLRVWDGYQAYHPHNILLKVQTELGIIGTITFLLFIICVVVTCYKSLKQNYHTNNKILIIGFISSFFAFQWMNIIDNFYTPPKLLITMFIVLAFLNYSNSKPKSIFK
ncbi:O-antigen ligase family protein [Clostridium sp. NSJ-145]|uniref:O-antigen ligase family protein n=1 Tax=Clostridium sp. NSJ-145 TaxID=2897777 RepID=UPI001E32FA5D|nr:O-antigen ligase family protein [Clostridium sp. NSJ-145]MCD2501287.1 O-antigen ligase family protein [Clostridium sp. NSJ-145]